MFSRIAVALLISLSVSPVAKAKTDVAQKPLTADQLVQQLYKQDSALIVASTNDSHLKKYFDKPLADLLYADHHAADDGDTLDFDPMFDTNGDTATEKFQISPAKVQGNKASVEVKFRLKDGSLERRVVFALNNTPQGWRIADLNTKDWDLVQLLKHLHPTK